MGLIVSKLTGRKRLKCEWCGRRFYTYEEREIYSVDRFKVYCDNSCMIKLSNMSDNQMDLAETDQVPNHSP